MKKDLSAQVLAIVVGVLFLFALVFSVGFFLGSGKNKVVVQERPVLDFEGRETLHTTLVAINTQGKGVPATLITELRDGSGLVLVNINDVLADVETQVGARKAKQVAEKISNKNLAQTDVIFNIITNASLVSGESAGAAMTLTVLALAEEKEINHSVLITGAINETGDLIDAAGIRQKAQAAKDAGAQTLLIPPGALANDVYYQKVRRCGTINVDLLIEEEKDRNEQEYCETHFEAKRHDIQKELGINVKEVRTIQEAARSYII